jgi:hypothetical protein
MGHTEPPALAGELARAEAKITSWRAVDLARRLDREIAELQADDRRRRSVLGVPRFAAQHPFDAPVRGTELSGELG